MIFEVQVPYPLKETDGKNFDGSYTVERWLSRKLKENKGKLVIFSSTGGDSTLTVQFDDYEDAKTFNKELRDFFTPRMYLDTEKDGTERYKLVE